jgi:hypothetical protein
MSDISISQVNVGNDGPNYAIYVRGGRVGTVAYAGRVWGRSHFRYANRPGTGSLWSERTYLDPMKAAQAFVRTLGA